MASAHVEQGIGLVGDVAGKEGEAIIVFCVREADPGVPDAISRNRAGFAEVGELLADMAEIGVEVDLEAAQITSNREAILTATSPATVRTLIRDSFSPATEVAA